MRKIGVILFTAIFVIGCDVNYNININDELNVTETITVNGGQLDNEEMIDYDYNNNYEYLSEKNYSTSKNGKNIKLENEFENINSYLDNSKFYTQYFENLSITEKENKIYIETTGSFYKYVMNPSYDKFHIDKTNINITLPFKVISNNADIIDEKSNTYTWTVTDKTKNKKIELVFAKTKKELTILPKYIYLVVGIIIILLFVSMLIFRILSKKNNEL